MPTYANDQSQPMHALFNDLSNASSFIDLLLIVLILKKFVFWTLFEKLEIWSKSNAKFRHEIEFGSAY